MIRLSCPRCQKQLGIKDELAGRLVACPKCQARIRVPQPEAKELEEVDDAVVESISTAPRRGRRPPPHMTRRADEEEDRREAAPRSRRLRDDEGDEEDEEEPRPRPIRKRKKKRRGRRSGAAGGMGGALIALGVVAAVCLVMVVVSIFVPALAVVPIGLGWVISLAGGIWFLVCAFQDDVTQGLLCLFVPFYSLIYLISHFEEVKKPFFVQVIGVVLLMGGGCAGGLGAAKEEKKMYNPRAQLQAPWAVLPAFACPFLKLNL